jgi:hypothetical protein
LDALGEVVILDHVRCLHILMINGVILLYQGKRSLMVEVLPLALHLQVRFR